MKIYGYRQCGTCRKAQKWLAERGLDSTMIPIRETPPSVPELAKMLAHFGGQRKRLLNTSSADYRAPGLKESLAAMSDDDFCAALHAHGNLIKRPFLLTKQGGTTGFQEAEWAQLLA